MTTKKDEPQLRSDEELASTWVGERKPHNAPVTLVAYDPSWPELFAREAERIRHLIGEERVLALEHVGSTSVPGLAAKPILDILLVVPDSADEAAYVEPLERAGYRLRIREPDWWEHRVLKGPDTDVNLHVFGPSAKPEIERMLAFRDRLRSHDDERILYETTKRALAARTWRHIQHYADAKKEVVEGIIARAFASRSPS
jgi:GrpB-like predicted nucleotidyltransferase (UPF0157 family)